MSVWQQILVEAREASEQEPALASFYFSHVLNHAGLAQALAYTLAVKLGSKAVSSQSISDVIQQVIASEPNLQLAAEADINAYYERDPACDKYLLPLLFFKGWQAVQGYRVSHYLWQKGKIGLAFYLHSQLSSVFAVDIHPAARIGSGIMLDHATGLVVGETASVGNNVSILHGVSLGGSGCSGAVRHPQVGNGVLIAAGAKLLGHVVVGDGAKIAAGSVVLDDVPAHTTVAGVPAKVVGVPRQAEPALDMDQKFDT